MAGHCHVPARIRLLGTRDLEPVRPSLIYGIVQKTRRKDRVIRVEREERIGAPSGFKDVL